MRKLISSSRKAMKRSGPIYGRRRSRTNKQLTERAHSESVQIYSVPLLLRTKVEPPSALIADFDKLYISGFTFFKTPYAKGYRDNLLDMEINDKHIKAHGLHSPDLELKCF